MFFTIFRFDSLVFFNIAYDDSLEQCLMSSRSKTHVKNFGNKNLGQTDQNYTPNEVYCFFLKFVLLVYL